VYFIINDKVIGLIKISYSYRIAKCVTQKKPLQMERLSKLLPFGFHLN